MEMEALPLKLTLLLMAIIGLGVSDCSDNGSTAGDNADDRNCYISYKKDAVAIDIEFVQCCAKVDGEDVESEEQLLRCVDEADSAEDENFHEFEECPSTGSCLDRCHHCLDDCGKNDEGCTDDCFGELEACSAWYDTGCIENCITTRDDCWHTEMDSAIDFSEIDWDDLQECLVEFDECSDDSRLFVDRRLRRVLELDIPCAGRGSGQDRGD